MEHEVMVILSRYLTEPMSNWDFRSARQQYSYLYFLQQSSLGQQMYDDPDIIVIVALIKRINYNHVRRLAAVAI
jgi:hypothetical protein